MIRSRLSQRGNALLETILFFPVLIGSGLLAGDLYNLSQARAALESKAFNLSSILSVQSTLEEKSLAALIDAVTGSERPLALEIVIGKVTPDGIVAWRLQRGTTSGICPDRLGSRRYAGDLPENARPDDDAETSDSGMLVVQVCRQSRDLALGAALLADKTLENVAINRMRVTDMKLDDSLAREAGLEQL
ncbi:hypothetical protein [Pseudomonas sp. FW300-N2F2]|uniref:hypothetical protein n=1 Tax=Pseudomonas sp. FW300-N2F2 TaxID=2751320 RepID=UPI001A91A649|nr:hypothetical protein [Pseudomonas sp. FW300-N2F2]